jgi:hypothetical protein
MKYILYVIVLVVFVRCSVSDDNDGKAVESHKTDIIKSCKMYSSNFVILDPDDAGVLIQEFRFNKKGFVNELIRYDINGKIIGRFDILGENTPFTTHNKPQFTDTVIAITNIDSLGVVEDRSLKTYNKKGLLVKEEFFENDSNLVKKNTYKYNSDNLILEDIYWDIEMDKPKQKIRYEYEYYIN